MKVMSSVFLASILAMGSAFANVTVAKEISPAKSVDNVQ
ncbi:MAG: ankyrin repeat domain-containing protein, partial [Acinetobacter sp.]